MMAKALLVFGSLWILGQICTASLLPQKPLAPPEVLSHIPKPLPLVVWHGLGDNYKAEGLRSVGVLANTTNPGTFTYFIRLGDDASSDRTASFLGNLTLQIDKVCADLASHPVLSKAPAINALGFSQGGQFLRAYIERCNNPRVANLVTFGSQHNGISQFQDCASGDWLCRGWDALLRGNTWSESVQSRLIPAQYFRDPGDLDSYLENSNFLADMNNEREVKNSKYKANMKSLDRFVMYIFEDDTTVVPKESGWFTEVNATTGEFTKLQDRKIYLEDWIGLRWLDEEHRLEFRSTEGSHMTLSNKLLIDVFRRYFGRPPKGAVDKSIDGSQGVGTP